MPERRAYLDYNASAPLLPAAREAMIAALANDANPSSVHAEGRAARAIVENARRSVAGLAGARSEHVTFTSGATEAAATLLSPEWRMGRGVTRMSRLYVLASDHPCLLSGGRFTSQNITQLPVGVDGVADLAALEAALGMHDRELGLPLVALHLANNETGVIQPLRTIAAAVKAAGGVLVVDATQAPGRLSIDISNDCGDFFILSSHKIGGPKGAGAIVARSDLLMPAPLLSGGGQEKGHRAGTENVAAIAGFGAAAIEAARATVLAPALLTKRQRVEHIIRKRAPGAVIHAEHVERLPNTVLFSLRDMKSETAQIAFDLAGVALSAGSACSSGKVGPSHVLKAMGSAEGTGLRVSIGHATSDADLALFDEALGTLVGRRAHRHNAA